MMMRSRQRYLMADGADFDFDPTSLGSVWGGGDDATTTTAIPTSVWGDGDEVTAAILEAVPTRKRKHMAAARADDTGDGATATADFDPTSAWPLATGGMMTRPLQRTTLI